MSFDPKTVLDFWFKESSPEDWFQKSEEYDQKIKERFEPLIDELSTTPNQELLSSPEKALASVIVLDQFPRNIYRDSAKSYAYDSKALKLVDQAIAQHLDQKLPEVQRRFLYMPFMHSEDVTVHNQAVKLFSSLKNKVSLKYEYHHKYQIDRFGRYPHRNNALGRESTREEKRFLEKGDGLRGLVVSLVIFLKVFKAKLNQFF